MVSDITLWNVPPYNVWGLFWANAHDIRPFVQEIYEFCAQLDKQKNSATVFSGTYFLSPNQAYLASYFAAKIMPTQRHIANNLGTEILLYLSVQNQISTAQKLFGIKDDQKSQGEFWFFIFLSVSLEELTATKASLEDFLEVPLDDNLESTPRGDPESIASALNLSPTYLSTMGELQGTIPDLPVEHHSPQETIMEQVLIERMVLLSLDKFNRLEK